MRKFLIYVVLITIASLTAYLTFIYFVNYSEGVRAGELIRMSHKGVAFKTYEGEISQGISGAQIFSFSVMSGETKLIEDLKALQGQYVKVTYIERYRTFPWWGDSRFYVKTVQKEDSPFNSR